MKISNLIGMMAIFAGLLAFLIDNMVWASSDVEGVLNGYYILIPSGVILIIGGLAVLVLNYIRHKND
ncbi:hypothetical protein H9L19_01750 [Weissella diestrammenae]|uniref:DUF3955 domain-containing protein n=1 Tax=Weissella diestrammenae TaxID=1162633 RepID=A0A7G9T6A0_9LACO|nr:hypothetical protein [Weissella diestrammenae]MCM0583329.1 hypothetical protein [Weissella diestrammenae]QNN75625.1 hypothetical protein H9L19_01750 [Weissella diestrammenae]